jgi:hypothetical protein
LAHVSESLGWNPRVAPGLGSPPCPLDLLSTSSLTPLCSVGLFLGDVHFLHPQSALGFSIPSSAAQQEALQQKSWGWGSLDDLGHSPSILFVQAWETSAPEGDPNHRDKSGEKVPFLTWLIH